MKNIIIIFFCMFMLMFQATAQNHADVKEIEVSGIVLDSNKDPLIGANIVVKNVPGLGVITNIDGKFKIKVELYQRLIVSYIGFESQEILIKDKKTLTVIMQESKSSVLDEVVITGTGEQKKITVTGAVSSANIAHLNVSPSGNLVNALAGNVPGVLSMQSSGAPGQNTSEFWIRGISTFGAKTSALVLVDGFERDMDDISIEDIESFQVLKDASETAIYGAPAGFPQDFADIRHQICRPLRVLRPFSIAVASLASAQGIHFLNVASKRPGIAAANIVDTGRSFRKQGDKGRCRVINIKKIPVLRTLPKLHAATLAKGAQAGLNQRPWVIPRTVHAVYPRMNILHILLFAKYFRFFAKIHLCLAIFRHRMAGRVLCHSLVPDSVLRLGSGK